MKCIKIVYPDNNSMVFRTSDERAAQIIKNWKENNYKVPAENTPLSISYTSKSAWKEQGRRYL